MAATAWKLAGRIDNMWDAQNYPAYYGLVFGRGPMLADEVTRLDR